MAQWARGEDIGEGEGGGGGGGERAQVARRGRGEGIECARGGAGRGEGQERGDSERGECVGEALFDWLLAPRVGDWFHLSRAAPCNRRAGKNSMQRTVRTPSDTVPTNLSTETPLAAMVAIVCRQKQRFAGVESAMIIMLLAVDGLSCDSLKR